jgi:carbon monoxide dehydrogenase subunit G
VTVTRLRVPWLALLGLLLAACGQRRFDWRDPENLLLKERSTQTDAGLKLEYWSLVDAPATVLYALLADVESYPEFVPGVDSVQVLSETGDTKTVQISQHVVSRQDNAKVEWRFAPLDRRIDFKTLNSNGSYEDGACAIDTSPDGSRSLVRTSILVHDGQGAGQTGAVGILVQATREAFLTAARSVKKRAVEGLREQ